MTATTGRYIANIPVVVVLVGLLVVGSCGGFSVTTTGNIISNTPGDPSNWKSIPDRFLADGHVSEREIQHFDPSLNLPHPGSDDEVSFWVAVYRNPQCYPDPVQLSATVRDEFMEAMKSATRPDDDDDDDDAEKDSHLSSTATTLKWVDKLHIPQLGDNDGDHFEVSKEGPPVAVARLRPINPHHVFNTFILDSLRCSLPKEATNPDCDGGSEYLEALGVAVDTILLTIFQQELQSGHEDCMLTAEDRRRNLNGSRPRNLFNGSIRVKATLFSRTVLENRGFVPVESLSKDMATHVLCRETCLEQYTQRSLNCNLGRESRTTTHRIKRMLMAQFEYFQTLQAEKKAATPTMERDDDVGMVQGGIDPDEDRDPWAGSNRMQL